MIDKKYTKESGMLINFCEIEIGKKTKNITITEKAYPVLISDNKCFVIEGRYKSFDIINRKRDSYSSFSPDLNKVVGYSSNLGLTYSEETVSAKIYTTLSAKRALRACKKHLMKLINKENWFYSDLAEKLENSIVEYLNQK